MTSTTNNNTTLYQKNVDFEEVMRFNAIADSWWHLDGKFKLLHQINPLRLDYILNRACGLFGKKVLDVGCGGGILTESMAREGAEVTGLDIGTESLAVAQSHALENGLTINYIQQTIEEHAEIHSGIYDVVTCMEMLEHILNPMSIVCACAQLVKPGGDVFFSTLNQSLKAWLMVIVGAEYVLRMIPRGTHNINKFIKPAKLLSWIDKTLLHEQHIIGLYYNPLWDNFKFSQNVDLNYLLHTRKCA